jgi:hypothetical protein
MDNRITLKGYKYYVDRESEVRPAVFVTFLNVIEDLSQAVNGILLPVTSRDLESLDERERNYARLDVTDRILEPVDGSVWAYVGSVAARRRYEGAAERGVAVVDAAYYGSVKAQFEALDGSAYTEYLRTTDEPECPLRELRRVDL